MAETTVYILPGGEEIHIEDPKRPAVLFSNPEIYCMGNNTGIVIGSPVAIPDPKKCPGMIAGQSEGICHLLPEDQWPRPNAETPFVRGLVGSVDYERKTMEQYMNRLHILGIAVRN